MLEYSKSYSKRTVSFWNYYRDEPNSGSNNNIDYSIKDSKSFDYKTSIAGKLEQHRKRSWSCCAIKTFKQFLESTKHAIN